MYYSTIGVLAALVLFIENRRILLKRNPAFLTPVWLVYRRFLISVLCYYATDVLWGVLESLKLPVLLFADTTAYFIAMAAVILSWSQFVAMYLGERNLFERLILFIGHSIFLLIIVLSVINIFTPVLFTVDSASVYRGLITRNAILIAQIVVFLLISVYTFSGILRQRNAREMWPRYRTIGFFGIIMAVFVTAQFWSPYLPLYAVACMVGICLLYNSVVGIVRNEYMNKLEKAKETEEHLAYSRLNALSGDFLCVYVVVPETGQYREFSSTEGYLRFNVPKEGEDFFTSTREKAKEVTSPDDIERFLSTFTREGVISEIERCGIFSLTYRLMIDNRPNYVQLKAAMVEEEEGKRLIVGVNDIDAFVRQEEKYARRLAQAQIKANIDALTGVKNRHAYLDEEGRLDLMIAEHHNPGFAIVIFDVNDLKKVNDTKGHQAGDEYICEASKLICNTFKHSPVYRVGGDEFAVVALGEDYSGLEELLKKVHEHNEKAGAAGDIVIACGAARYENDSCTADVFERADLAMYENKEMLKSEKG